MKDIVKILTDEIVEHGTRSILLCGNNSKEKLRETYESVSSSGLHACWIENPATENEFWFALLAGARQDENFTRQLEEIKHLLSQSIGEAACLAENTIRNLGHSYHVFIPEIYQVFYRFDFEQQGYNGQHLKDFLNGRFNNELRAVWTNEENLGIHGSATETESEKYMVTLGNYEFGFFAGNFLQYHTD